MKLHAPLLLAGLLSAALPAPTVSAQELSPERVAILERAFAFASVRWRAEERHVFHGVSEAGVRVDTPDVSLDPTGFVPGAENVGMPYCWGGFTSLERFEVELAEERWAGHVPLRGNAMGSSRTLGVDCSGFVSRAWSLPQKQSTRSLGKLCYELDDYDQLLPGDVVNRFDAHVALFTGWRDEARTEMHVIEAARIKVEESTYTVADLRARSFRPMRYVRLDPRWAAMPRAEPAEGFAVPAGARPEFTAGGALAAETDPLPETLRAGTTAPGDWARYAASEGLLADARCTWMAVENGPTSLGLQRLLETGADSLATTATLPLGERWPALLAAFGNFSDPMQDLEVTSCTLAAGTCRLGARELPARRLTAVVEGRLLSRSTLYPVRLEVDCVLSDEVPLFGLCSATLRLEIDYGTVGESRAVGEEERRYELTAFGRG